jgi:hypothetical protein
VHVLNLEPEFAVCKMQMMEADNHINLIGGSNLSMSHDRVIIII